jgi:hypothetical protein
MNEYKKPELLVIYLGQTDVLVASPDGDIVEPGDDWE